MRKFVILQRKWLRFTLIALSALGVAVIMGRLDLHYLECWAYDLRVRFAPAPSPSRQILPLVIDQTTVEGLGHFPTVREHTLLLQRLARAKPRAVVYFIPLTDLVGSPEEFSEFARVVGQLKNFFVGINDTALPAEQNKFALPPPLDKIRVVQAPVTEDRSNFARDGVTRRMLTSYEGQTMLHFQLARLATGPQVEADVRGVFPLLGSNQVFVRFHPRGTYQGVSFLTAFNGEIEASAARDKFVIVGRDSNFSVNDYVQTPWDRSALAMSRLEAHANMLDTLLLNNAPIRTPRALTLVFTAFFAILTMLAVLTMSPARGIVVLLSALAGWIGLAWGLYATFGVWLEMVHVVLVIFIVYYFLIPYRLVVENRRTWEYQQRNELLVQVEELKTNFLSMMSHDIKTPLARMQGMTDIVLRDGERLTSTQHEALATIRSSIDELVEFISSILSLSRVEGKRVQLNLVSKDLNVLLQEVIARYQYLAREKSIEIRSELEPLFSLRIDVDLMRQVFANLIENAIKYSPENSNILVSSEEKDGRVMVQIADQGPGIPRDELEHVFAKFYRAKGAKASQVKGSGLGLYLAQYFVQLHGGNISVESEMGIGSTFTVNLPST